MVVPSPTVSLQALSDDLLGMGDVLACYVVNKQGMLLAANYGELPVDEDLKASFSKVTSSIWQGLDKVTNLGGPIRAVVATYENFRILGLPIKGTNIAILLTVETKLDPVEMSKRAEEFTLYWLKVNRYVE